MSDINSLYERIFSVNPSTFDQLALDIFKVQYEGNRVYNDFVNALGVDAHKVKAVSQIPFLPIEFFKSHEVRTGSWMSAQIFESSGTTGSKTSRHHVHNIDLYLKNCLLGFETAYGPAGEYAILALLPSYLERGNSGLVTMVNSLINHSNSDYSGFYLNELQQLYERLKLLKKTGQKTILLGVTFALLDFAAEYSMDFPDLIVMETGGMKGRREEMVREDVHKVLKDAFGVNEIHSEYGMTELFSQAYSAGEGVFRPMRTMKVLMRDLNDPLHYPFKGRNGGLNVIDLANIHTCSFIETQDMGLVYVDGSFQVRGRIDNSDVRGCNLIIF